MKKILFYAVLTLLLAAMLCSSLVSCNKDKHLTHDMVIDETLTVKATCVKDGSETYKCQDCDHQVTVVIKSTGHQFSKPEVVLPTCTEEGAMNYRCVVCDEGISDLLDPLGHSYGLPTNIVAPGPAQQGSLTFKCERCDDTQLRVLEPTG